MKKLIVFLLSVLLFSCKPKSYVSDSEAIVESVEYNKDDRNKWKYLVKAVYVNDNIDLTNDADDSRTRTNLFYLYKYSSKNNAKSLVSHMNSKF